MMDEQRISVDTCRIALKTQTGLHLEGEVFLPLYGSHLDGGQRVEDLLNGDDHFLPLRHQQGTELINLDQIVSVVVSAEREFDPLIGLGREYPVRVESVTGEVIAARIFVNLPGSACRVKDFLNQKKRFLLFLREDQVVYVARDKIVRVAD